MFLTTIGVAVAALAGDGLVTIETTPGKRNRGPVPGTQGVGQMLFGEFLSIVCKVERHE